MLTSPHKMGHTIDIIATFDNNPVISNLEANGYDVSHHFLVDFDVAIHPEIRAHKKYGTEILK